MRKLGSHGRRRWSGISRPVPDDRIIVSSCWSPYFASGLVLLYDLCVAFLARRCSTRTRASSRTTSSSSISRIIPQFSLLTAFSTPGEVRHHLLCASSSSTVSYTLGLFTRVMQILALDLPHEPEREATCSSEDGGVSTLITLGLWSAFCRSAIASRSTRSPPRSRLRTLRARAAARRRLEEPVVSGRARAVAPDRRHLPAQRQPKTGAPGTTAARFATCSGRAASQHGFCLWLAQAASLAWLSPFA